MRRLIGRGGMGDVYEAVDRETGSNIAIKTLRRLDGESLYRFKQEFRSLADLEHENLVEFGELYCEADQWFFTMELVRGVHFLDYVRPDARPRDGASPSGDLAGSADDTRTVATRPTNSPSTGPGYHSRTPVAGEYDEPRLRRAARQLAVALDVVHASGRVHRDVKPSNALVTDDGRVVLMDFGLVGDMDTLRGGDHTAGTPAYMAPEQIVGDEIGPAADWYAFGVLLFHSLTGMPPFRGSTAGILQAKSTFDALEVHQHVAGAPDDLNELCRDLLRRQPHRRPSGSEVLERLGAAPAAATTLAPQGDADPEAPFVGRRDELEQLGRALDDTAEERTVAVLVRGEPGVGKSTLVERFLRVRARQHAVLRGRCYEQEAVPFRAFDSVVDSLSQYLLGLREAETRRLLRGGVHFLAGVFPVLSRLPAVAELAPLAQATDTPTERRELAFRQLKSLLAELARSAPLVIFIDDLQWADTDSLALLRDLLRPPDSPGCLFMATTRPLHDVEPGTAELFDELQASFRTIDLEGLTPDQANALVASLWGRAGGGDEAAHARARSLIAEAEGHPLLITELTRFARESDSASDTHVHLEDVLWRRIESLDAPDRALMEASALAGVPMDHRVLTRAAGVSADDRLPLLNRLRNAQLVTITRRGDERLIEPYHDRIREAILTRLRAGDRERVERLHHRIARELVAWSDPERLDDFIFTIVGHLDRARSRVTTLDARLELARLHLRAARKAKSATAYEAAGRHVARAIELLPEGVWSSEYELARGVFTEQMEVDYLRGRHELGAERFHTLLERLATDAERVDVHITKIGIDTGQGRSLDAIATARSALPLCGMTLPDHVGNAHVLAEYAKLRWNRGRRAIPDLADLPEMRDPQAHDAMRVLMAVSPAAYFVDSILLSFVLLRMANTSLRLGVCDVSSYGLAGYGLVMTAVFGKHAQAHELGEVSLALNERFRNDALTSRLYFISGTYLAPWVRPFSEALERIRIGCEAGRRTGDAAYEAYAAATLSVMMLNQATDLEAQHECARWSRRITSQRRDLGMTSMVTAHQRYYETMRGLTGDVLSLSTEESSDADFRAGLSESTPLGLFYYYMLNAELQYLFGDAFRARSLLRECDSWLSGVFGIPTTAEHCFLQALIAARALDDAPRAERRRLRRRITRCSRKLARWARSCPDNFEAQYRITEAERARVTGRASEASRLFRGAVDAARRHGATKREALALELGARHAAATDDAALAESLRHRAIDAYRRWGAHARAAFLEAPT